MTFAAHRDRLIMGHNDRAWAVWHTAALSRAKKITPLRELLIKAPAPKLAMDEQIKGLVRWVEATGGKVIYRNG